MDIEKLHEALAAVAPIEGVSIGRWARRDTWRIDFARSATPAQRAAAQAVVLAFDATVPPPSPAQQLVRQVLADPAALAELRAALGRS